MMPGGGERWDEYQPTRLNHGQNGTPPGEMQEEKKKTEGRGRQAEYQPTQPISGQNGTPPVHNTYTQQAMPKILLVKMPEGGGQQAEYQPTRPNHGQNGTPPGEMQEEEKELRAEGGRLNTSPPDPSPAKMAHPQYKIQTMPHLTQ